MEALKNNIDVITTNAGGPKTIIKKSPINLVNIRNNSYENVVRDFTNKIIKFYSLKKKRIYKLNKLTKLNLKYKNIYFSQ